MTNENGRATTPARWENPWGAHWAAELRERLAGAAEALERMLGLTGRQLGVLPAVYFTRLRMGSVPFFSWDERTADVRLAFPWNPSYVPPPFTCFAPPLSRTTERWFGLISRVASLVDDFIAGDEGVASLSESDELRDLRVGVASWSDKDPSTIAVDDQYLRESGVRMTTAVFLLPAASGWMPHVPLLYFQANEPYDIAAMERTILQASNASQERIDHGDDARALRRGLRAAVRTAHLRAREWLTPKTQLLNRAGFEGLRDDLQWRLARGDEYAELFFDIDEFKKANEAHTYDGADLLAARVTDRVVEFIQREVARAYEHAGAVRRATGKADVDAPDSFRALLAHVSGDEFRLFIRIRSFVESESVDELDAKLFASGLIQSVRDSPLSRTFANPDSREARHQAALVRSSAALRTLTGIDSIDTKVLDTTATVSGGLACLDRIDVSDRQKPSTDDLARARRALANLDIPAEKAAKRAKEAGRDRYQVAEPHEFISDGNPPPPNTGGN